MGSVGCHIALGDSFLCFRHHGNIVWVKANRVYVSKGVTLLGVKVDLLTVSFGSG